MNPIEAYHFIENDDTLSDHEKEFQRRCFLFEGLFDNDDIPEYELIETLTWESEGKFSSGGVVVMHEGVHYMFSAIRSGSYYDDFHYEFHGPPFIVKPVDVVIQTWEEVK